MRPKRAPLRAVPAPSAATPANCRRHHHDPAACAPAPERRFPRRRVAARKRPRAGETPPPADTDLTEEEEDDEQLQRKQKQKQKQKAPAKEEPRRSQRVRRHALPGKRARPDLALASSSPCTVEDAWRREGAAGNAAGERRAKRVCRRAGEGVTAAAAAAATVGGGVGVDDGRADRQMEDEIVREVMKRRGRAREPATCEAAVREVLVDWMMEVGDEFAASGATVALAVSYLDRVVEKVRVPRFKLQLLAVVCMWIACKMEETEAPGVADMVYMCNHLYTRDEVLAMEESVLNHLDFCMTTPTPFSLLAMMGRRVGGGVEDVVEFVGYVAMMDDGVKTFGPGIVGLGCVMASCWIVGLDGTEVRTAVGWRVWDGAAEHVIRYARRVLRVWKGVARRHEMDLSRWVLIRWEALHRRVLQLERDGRLNRLGGAAPAAQKKGITCAEMPR